MFTEWEPCGIIHRNGRPSGSSTICRLLPVQPTKMSRDSTQAYLNEIGRYPLLTKSQELTLGSQIQAWIAIEKKEEYTDQEKKIRQIGLRAKAKFINCNLRLVVNVARKYARFCSTLEFMDLIQEGNIGLVRAIEKFDPTRGYAFSTYAYWWIRQSIQRSMQVSDSCIRLPIGIHDMIHKIKKTAEQLAKELGRDPTINEIAEAADIKIEDVKSTIDAPRITLSLDKPIADDGISLCMIDVIADEKNSNTIYDAETRMNIEDAYIAIDTYLDEQTRFIVLERSKAPPTSWKELASVTGISKARLQTMEKDGLRRCALLLAIKSRLD